MNWVTILEVTGGALLLLFALLRVERKRLWVVALIFVLPVGWLGVVWANFYHLWAEVITGVVIAGALAGAWWLFYGRKLPAPTSDNISVWGQDDTPNKPKAGQLQSEVERLRADKEQLEAELRRLKGGSNGKG